MYAAARRDEGGPWSVIELRCESLKLLANEQSFFLAMGRALVQGFGPGRFAIGRLVAPDGDEAGARAGERILASVAKKVERVSAVTRG